MHLLYSVYDAISFNKAIISQDDKKKCLTQPYMKTKYTGKNNDKVKCILINNCFTKRLFKKRPIILPPPLRRIAGKLK